jgi:D-tyrosyl-tRNA(Tyr) deacylase
MRAVLQRVSRASVAVGGEVVGRIDRGWLALVGVGDGDGPGDAAWLADKVAHLRAFADADGKMNRSVLDVGGGVLSVSQFTLHADCRKGRRPSFVGAARPEVATLLYGAFGELLRGHGVPVAEGRFGADMQVELVNDGPVTLILDSRTGDR